MSDEKKIRHVKKFMDGKMTPDEAHRAYGIRKDCYVCGQPAAIRIKVLYPYDDFMRDCHELAVAIMMSNPDGEYVPTISTTEGRMVKISDVGACDMCRVEAERAAANGPSWAVVEIDRKGLSSSHRVSAAVPGEIP